MGGMEQLTWWELLTTIDKVEELLEMFEQHPEFLDYHATMRMLADSLDASLP